MAAELRHVQVSVVLPGFSPRPFSLLLAVAPTVGVFVSRTSCF